MTDRIARFRERLAELNAPPALVTDAVNVGYLTGFTGSTAALLVAPDAAVFITDSRYVEQAKKECGGLEVVMAAGSGAYPVTIGEQARRLGLRELAIEADHTSVAEMGRLAEKLDGITLKPTGELVDFLRRVKDREEVETIRRACGLADRAFEFVLTLLKPGAVEREIAAELEYFMKRSGSEKEAFDTIVASGPRSALPHGRAADRALQEGDFITFDFGARIDGYNSDLTRTVALGRADAKQREVYSVVLEAQAAAIEAIRGGASGTQVDAAARDRIKARGYGEYFGHGLGHGLGRRVHDHRGMSPHEDVTLEVGMVLTVEPGVYLPGWGGVRIEDDVLVTETGREILTHAPKELIEVPL